MNGISQQVTLAKFTSWDARNTFFKAWKTCKFYVKADLTKENDEVVIYARNKIHTDTEISKFVKYV